MDGGRRHAQSRWGHVCNDVLCVVCVVCVYACVCVGGWPWSWVGDVEQGSTVDGGRRHAQSRWGHVCNDVLCVVCVVCVYACVCVGGRGAGSGTWSRAALWTEVGVTLSHVGSTSVDECCVCCVCVRVCVCECVCISFTHAPVTQYTPNVTNT